MAQLVLARHGETEWSRAHRASPRIRALRTAQLTGLDITEVTDDLAEWNHGAYEGGQRRLDSGSVSTLGYEHGRPVILRWTMPTGC